MKKQLVAVLCLLAMTNFLLACTITGMQVKRIADAKGDPLPDRFNETQVQDHFATLIISDNIHNSFHCVDARNDQAIFGTPGGDLSTEICKK